MTSFGPCNTHGGMGVSVGVNVNVGISVGEGETDRQMDEIVDSRSKLQALLGLPILTFAYPFGAYDKDALHYVHFAGYSAAMGLGNDTLQGNKNLFYLYRMVVNGNQNLESFALLLPWRGELTNLTALTLVP